MNCNKLFQDKIKCLTSMNIIMNLWVPWPCVYPSAFQGTLYCRVSKEKVYHAERGGKKGWMCEKYLNSRLVLCFSSFVICSPALLWIFMSSFALWLNEVSFSSCPSNTFIWNKSYAILILFVHNLCSISLNFWHTDLVERLLSSFVS